MQNRQLIDHELTGHAGCGSWCRHCAASKGLERIFVRSDNAKISRMSDGISCSVTCIGVIWQLCPDQRESDEICGS